jgi:mRNA interferase RelE/StbE
VDRYSITIKPSALKEIEQLPTKTLRKKIITKIESLAANPRPRGCVKLSGDDKYRLRQGEYRILYAIDDAAKAVDIVRIGHRRDIYR